MDTISFIKLHICSAVQSYTYKVKEMYDFRETCKLTIQEFINSEITSMYYEDMLSFMFRHTYQPKCEEKAWKQVRSELADFLDNNWFTIKKMMINIADLLEY